MSFCCLSLSSITEVGAIPSGLTLRISYFSVAGIKHKGQSDLGRSLFCLQVKEGVRVQRGRGRGSRKQAGWEACEPGSLHLKLQSKREAESKLQVIKISNCKVHPCPPPQHTSYSKATPPKTLQTASPHTGCVFKCSRLRGTFLVQTITHFIFSRFQEIGDTSYVTNSVE